MQNTLAPNQMLSAMISLCAQRHVDQYDSLGVPYILHPIKVMHYLHSDDYELMCIAIGHDLIEDTKTTFSELATLGISVRVIDGIKALTKTPGESHDEMMVRLMKNIDACRVKLADLRHNSDIRRGKGLREKDFDRLQKYHVMWKTLKSHIESVKYATA